MGLSKTIKKTILIMVAILAVTAAFSLLQYSLQGYITNISWKSRAYLFLEDGTQYAGTVPVEVEGTGYTYNVHYGSAVDSLEIIARARDNEVEIFNGAVVYNFPTWKWQWVIHNREVPREKHVNQQAMFTNFDRKKPEESYFLFCIDDVSKITDGVEPGKKGLLLVTKWPTKDAAQIVEDFMQDTESGAAAYVREYGIFRENGEN